MELSGAGEHFWEKALVCGEIPLEKLKDSRLREERLPRWKTRVGRVSDRFLSSTDGRTDARMSVLS